MSAPIHILIVEDRPEDAEIEVKRLGLAGFDVDWQRVDLRDEFVAKLSPSVDLIMADYAMPGFGAEQALELLKTSGLDIPFIIVSGTLGDEKAVELMKLGATDYILKNNLARLGEVVRRALAEKQLRMEKRQTEQALRESEERYRGLIETSPDAIVLFDLEGTIRFCNQTAAVMTGYAKAGELVGKSAFGLAPPEQQPLIMNSIAEGLRGENRPTEFLLLRQDGGVTPAELRSTTIKDASGEPSGFLVIARDITERKQKEDELIESHARLSAFANAMPDLVFILGSDGTYVDILGGEDDLLADRASRILGRKAADILPEEQADLILKALRETIRTNAAQIVQYALDVTAGHRWFEGRLVPMDSAPGEESRALLVARDITDRKSAEEQVKLALSSLAQQHARLEALYRSGQLLNSTLDIEVVLNYLTQEAMRATEATHGQVLVARKELGVYERRSLIGFSEDQARRAASEPLPLKQGVNGRAYVTQHIVQIDNAKAEADYFPFIPKTRSELVIPIIREGEVLGNLDLQSPKVGAFREVDVTYLTALADRAAIAIQNARLYENLEAYNSILEQAVKDRTVELEGIQDRLQSILDNSPDPILLIGRPGSIETGNPALYRMFQADPDTLRHKPMSELIMPEHVERFQAAFQDVMLRRDTQRLEMTARRTDGSQFSVDMALAPVKDDTGGVGAVCNLRDISAFKELEGMKDAFVSNVSHELRTPITGIKLNLDLLKRDPERQERYLARLVREVSRLNDLIEDILRLSRLDQGRVDLELAPTDLGRLASQYVADRQPIAESREISLVSGRQKQLPLVAADEGLLGQALSVLLTNALNYTPAGGTVTVRAHRNKVGQKYWVGISVSDTGPGISAEERQNLFERFFRGKVGRASSAPGTGLGLAIAKEIVGRHHGRIEVKSEGIEGKGATFTLWLPTEGDQ